MAKILVADDSLAELQIIQQTLQSTGHSIVTVMDGEAAEAKAKSEKFDLIILDGHVGPIPPRLRARLRTNHIVFTLVERGRVFSQVAKCKLFLTVIS